MSVTNESATSTIADNMASSLYSPNDTQTNNTDQQASKQKEHHREETRHR